MMNGAIRIGNAYMMYFCGPSSLVAITNPAASWVTMKRTISSTSSTPSGFTRMLLTNRKLKVFVPSVTVAVTSSRKSPPRNNW